MQWFCTFLWNNLRTSVEEVDDGGNVKDVLVESGKKEYFVAPQRAADSKTKLLLTIFGLGVHKRMARVEIAVAQKIKTGAMNVIGS